MSSPTHHLQIRITGRVQGVGMRPWVCQQACALSLFGSVSNGKDGVIIFLQGQPDALEKFQDCLKTAAPIQAKIESIEVTELALANYQSFSIIDSASTGAATGNQILPDLAVCQSCLSEFHDPNNRRYHDPFISCADCGPRFSIQQQAPYDRNNLSMKDFELCDLCSQEYSSPDNRRYHIEGICCPNCGPSVSLYSANKEKLASGKKAVQQLAEIIQQGGIVAMKGIGGFHILCDASNPLAVTELRLRKRRQRKPFALMCVNLKQAQQYTEISEVEAELLTSTAAPIVLLEAKPNNGLANEIAPDTNRLGIMLAYSPLYHLLFEYLDIPLLATSANLAGEPIIYQQQALFEKLCSPQNPVVDWVLDHNREILNPCDDSVMQLIRQGKKTYQQTIRLGRGLAPLYGQLRNATSPTLAVGGQQKSAIAFASQNQWILSPYLGDLFGFEAQKRFSENKDRMQSLFNIQPEAFVADRHPGYFSTQFAQKLALENSNKLKQVQHHYAHLMVTMLEHQLTSDVLGFIWDGSGLGDDGLLWGGEVLLAKQSDYQRLFALKPFQLLGGEIAAKQPKRIALALLLQSYGLSEVRKRSLSLLNAFDESSLAVFEGMLLSQLNSPATTSIGRLFDAVASLLGLVHELDYEGQSGVLLENLYSAEVRGAYVFQKQADQLDWLPILEVLLQDLADEKPMEEMVSQFFNGLVNLVVEVAEDHPAVPIVLSGGVFQNRTLLQLILDKLKGRVVYFQQKTPINDGGISLGQLAVASENEQ